MRRCSQRLRGSDVKVASVVGFPFGASTTEVKALEARRAIRAFEWFLGRNRLGIPVAAIAGPLFARWAVKHVKAEPPEMAPRALGGKLILPGFGLTLFTILLPVALMLLGTLAELTIAKGDQLRVAATFIGNPTIALLVAVLNLLTEGGMTSRMGSFG